MKDWIRQQISVLHERFYNALQWIRQRLHWWISMQRERFYNASHDHQRWIITGWLIMLSFPIYLFVPTSLMGGISFGIIVGVWLIDYLWHDRYPALQRWIREIEYGENDGKDPHCSEELLPPSPIGRRVFRILGRIFSKWQSHQLSKWRSLQLFDRLYVLAFMMLMLGIVFPLIYGKPTKAFYGSILVAYGMSSIGFGLWLWPWLQRIWHWRLGKLALTLLHGGILLLSIIPARRLVAEALGLPPQDFDVTVAFCVLLFYLPLWFIVFMLLAAAFAFIHFVASALCSFTSYFIINVPVLLIAKVFPVGSSTRSFLEQDKSKFVWHGFMHMLGVMALLFGTILLLEWFSPVIARLQPVVRSIAYFADFQQVSLYPDVDVNKRLRLHENGIVSYAEKCGVVTPSSHQVDFFQIPLIIGRQWLHTLFPDICISVEKIQCQ